MYHDMRDEKGTNFKPIAGHGIVEYINKIKQVHVSRFKTRMI